MTAHTTAPWTIRRNPKTKLLFVGEYPIASVEEEGQFECDNRVYSDARLIAAAPELLAALEFCHTRLFNYQAGMDEIRDPQSTRELNEQAIDAARAAIAKAKGG